MKRIRLTNEEIALFEQHIISYEILMTKDNLSFFIGFDDELKDNINTELNVCWKQATFKEIAAPLLVMGTMKELELQEHWFLSLKTDLRAEYPLSNILETQTLLKDHEAILIRLELHPMSPSWYRECEEHIKNFKKGRVTSKTAFSAKDLGFAVVELALDGVYTAIDFANDLVTDEKIDHERIANNRYVKLLRNGLSNDTTEKSRYNAYSTKIAITVNSSRSDMLFRNIVKGFNSMAGDNSWILVEKSNYKNILSSRELAQIMQMPTKYYQDTYKISNIDNREIDIPKELLEPGIMIGTATLKGKEIPAYFSNNTNIRALPKIVIGPQNAGKTTTTVHFVVDSHRIGDANIVIDYIQDCELSRDIEENLPSDDVVVIRVHDEKNIFALAYTEASKLLSECSNTWDRLKIANLLASQVEYLINSVSLEGSGELTPRMLRYIYSACMVVFIHPGKVINDVFQVLRRWEVRNEYIRIAKYSECITEDDEIIYDLQELHDRDSKGRVIGTRENLISGILDRITVLNKNIYIKTMLKAPISYEIDFTEYIDQGKTVLIKIPQTTFIDQQVRDTLATYFMSRIWLAVQLREQQNNRLCHVIIDEVHQIKTCAAFIKNHINEFRRHRLGTLFTVHYLKQFRTLLEAVKSSGASYMLLAGTEKDNVKMLDEEIKPFTLEDTLNLKKYHSLNIINYGNQYTRFISKLPKPLQ